MHCKISDVMTLFCLGEGTLMSLSSPRLTFIFWSNMHSYQQNPSKRRWCVINNEQFFLPIFRFASQVTIQLFLDKKWAFHLVIYNSSPCNLTNKANETVKYNLIEPDILNKLKGQQIKIAGDWEPIENTGPKVKPKPLYINFCILTIQNCQLQVEL